MESADYGLVCADIERRDRCHGFIGNNCFFPILFALGFGRRTR
jgi:hypothetical protein